MHKIFEGFMGIIVNTNIAAEQTRVYLEETNKVVDNSIKHLSSGKRINSAVDDPGAILLADQLNTQQSGLNVAIRNGNDAVSTLQVAESAMQEQVDILMRMRDLALQSVNGSYTDIERQSFDYEYKTLQQEFNRIAETTKFGSQYLLDGLFQTEAFQVGTSPNDTVNISMQGTSGSSLGYEYRNTLQTPIDITGSTDSLTNLRQLQIKIDDISYMIDLNYAMQAEELQKEINNINGLADILVEKEALTGVDPNKVLSDTLSLSGFKVGNVNSQDKFKVNLLDSNGVSLISNQYSAQAAGFTAAISTEQDIATWLTKLFDSPLSADPKDTLDNYGIDVSVDPASAEISWSYDSSKNITSTDLPQELTLKLGFTLDTAMPPSSFEFTYTSGTTSDALELSYDSGTNTPTVTGSANSIINDTTNIPAEFTLDFTNAKITNGIKNVSFTQTESGVDTSIALSPTVMMIALGGTNIASVGAAETSLNVMDETLVQLDSIRANNAAVQTQLGFTNNNNTKQQVLIKQAYSNIVDLDFAKESIRYAKARVLQEAATMMLAQANQLPELALVLVVDRPYL